MMRAPLLAVLLLLAPAVGAWPAPCVDGVCLDVVLEIAQGPGGASWYNWTATAWGPYEGRLVVQSNVAPTDAPQDGLGLDACAFPAGGSCSTPFRSRLSDDGPHELRVHATAATGNGRVVTDHAHACRGSECWGDEENVREAADALVNGVGACVWNGACRP